MRELQIMVQLWYKLEQVFDKLSINKIREKVNVDKYERYHIYNEACSKFSKFKRQFGESFYAHLSSPE